MKTIVEQCISWGSAPNPGIFKDMADKEKTGVLKHPPCRGHRRPRLYHREPVTKKELQIKWYFRREKRRDGIQLKNLKILSRKTGTL